jgi:hypothetical protein
LKSYKDSTALDRGSKLVVSMVHNSHFFVIVIELTGKPSSDFNKDIEYFDLMDL